MIEYTVHIDMKQIPSLSGIIPSLICIGKIQTELNKTLVWHINESIMTIETAIEYLKRIVPEKSILEVKRVRWCKPIAKQQNTKKKQGRSKRTKRK
jgi:hypothetical protein